MKILLVGIFVRSTKRSAKNKNTHSGCNAKSCTDEMFGKPYGL